MFSWLGTDDRRKKEPEVFQTVSDGLKKLYKTKLLPLEESYKFHEFHSPALEDADFDNKPMVLLVGQYSTGKTSFIRWEHSTCTYTHDNLRMDKSQRPPERKRGAADTRTESFLLFILAVKKIAVTCNKIELTSKKNTQHNCSEPHPCKLYWIHKKLIWQS